MKKLIFLILTSFLIFSCTSQNNNQKNISWTWEIGNIWKKQAADCYKKCPWKTDKIIFWSFLNKNDNMCYYLWFADTFFLISEKTKISSLELYTWINLKEDLENENNKFENLLYENEWFWDLFKKINEKFWYSTPEYQLPHLFSPDIEKTILYYLNQYKIELSKDFVVSWTISQKDYEKSIDNYAKLYSNAIKKNKEEFLRNYSKAKIDINNLYNILYNLQKEKN